MQKTLQFFHDLLNAADWPARWVCGKWTTFHGWLYISSSIAIWAAYFAIPIILFSVIKKRADVPFKRILWLFILFIFACGATHLMDATMFWYPAYRMAAVFLMVTALISWATVVALAKILPLALTLKSPLQLEEIIEYRTSELEKSNTFLKKLNSDLDSFVYAASHDLKSPLNNIEALSNMIEEDVKQGNTPDTEAIARIKISVHKLKETISKLSDVARVQKDPYEDIETISISEILEEVIVENQELIQKAKPSFTIHFEEEKILYSRLGLKSILYNLLTNAAKYASPDRTLSIDIHTFKKEGHIALQIKDNGLGMDMERNKDKIFTIFKRFHDHVEGSGIGLYTIKNIVESKGGYIHVESELDKGTTFVVVLD
jgi:signal transduction histidine kinase